MGLQAKLNHVRSLVAGVDRGTPAPCGFGGHAWRKVDHADHS